MDKKLGIKSIGAQNTFTIKNQSSIGEDILLNVYEWTFVDYVGELGYIDTFVWVLNTKSPYK